MKNVVVPSTICFVAIVILDWWMLPSWLVGLITVSVTLGSVFALNRHLLVGPSLQEEEAERPSDKVAESIADSASKIAIGGATVSHFLDKLALSFFQQVDNAKSIADSITRLEEGNEALHSYTEDAESRIMASDSRTQESKVQLEKLLTQQQTLNKQIESAQVMISALKSSADSIGSITTTINQLADQTNMLALNAAIEAARAGDQGRGFAVVADEVRELAKKTTDATKGIDDLLSEINRSSRQSVEAIESVAQASMKMAEVVGNTSEAMETTSQLSQQAAQSMKQVKNTVNEYATTNQGISTNVHSLHHNIQSMESDLKDVSEKVLSLSHRTEDIFRLISIFNMHDRHTEIRNAAQKAAKAIGELFEQAILQGEISQEALFRFEYKKIPNTDPAKYSTDFDSFTDTHLPAIQEPILSHHNYVIYAGAVDINGYFPTHNKRFSQRLTGDYERDLAHNRTKRIFNDVTGSRCGKNTEAFLLQTYKRDTGEVMHDLSVPIFVNQRHWGGFRVGYLAETL